MLVRKRSLQSYTQPVLELLLTGLGCPSPAFDATALFAPPALSQAQLPPLPRIRGVALPGTHADSADHSLATCSSSG